MNKTYLSSIRADSCYPTFRVFVTVATVLLYIVAALVVVAGFVSQNDVIISLGIVSAVAIVLIAKVGQEVSLMIADISDVTIDSARRRSRSALSEESLHKQSSTRVVDKKAEVPAAAAPSDPMGVCPSCDSVIPLASETCKKCKADFGLGSAWKPKPLP